MGIPRSAAIAYPYGRPLGQVGDARGQRKILMATLSLVETIETAGSVVHFRDQWPEAPKDTHWHPAEMSPIVRDHLDDIKKAAKR